MYDWYAMEKISYNKAIYTFRYEDDVYLLNDDNTHIKADSEEAIAEHVLKGGELGKMKTKKK